MSLILDALNRAEHERKNQDTVPDLNSLHSAQLFNTAPDKRQTLWWVIGVVAVLLAIIIVLVMLLRREPLAQPAITQVAPLASPPPVIEPAASGMAIEAPIQTPIQAPVIEPKPVSHTAVIATKSTAPNAAIDKLYSSGGAETDAATAEGVNELYAAEAATAPASETIVDPFNAAGQATATAAVAHELAPPRTFDSIKNIPDFNSLPWNMRQQIPTITYQRHNYLADGISSVVINNQTTGVGNIIGTGQFVVQEIFVDGVVLKQGNAVFKMRALNGWINM